MSADSQISGLLKWQQGVASFTVAVKSYRRPLLFVVTACCNIHCRLSNAQSDVSAAVNILQPYLQHDWLQET